MRHHRVNNRVAHKSTGGVLPWTPQPVDPVGNPVPLTLNTVALPIGDLCITSARFRSRGRILNRTPKKAR